eukprot:8107093-Prorocentrum_lima.AAC.1
MARSVLLYGSEGGTTISNNSLKKLTDIDLKMQTRARLEKTTGGGAWSKGGDKKKQPFPEDCQGGPRRGD